MNLGERLREIREYKDLTLKQVADAIGISTSQLHYYETNATDIPWSKLYSLLDFYNIEPFNFIKTGDEYIRITNYSEIGKIKAYALDKEENKKKKS